MRGTAKAPFTKSIAATFTDLRTRFGIAAALLAVLGLALSSFVSADPLGEATFYKSGLRSSALVRNVALGADGNVWFVDNKAASGVPAIGRITPSGEITEYCATGCSKTLTGLNAESNPRSIVAGPGGSKYLWFTDSGTTPAIGVIDSASPETATEFSVQAKGGNAESKPVEITVGPDGNLWFTDEGATPAIGMIELSAENAIGKIEEFSTELKAGSRPGGIAAGPDGNLWFTDQGTTPVVGKINPSSHAIAVFETGTNSEPGGPFQEFGPHGIVAGADGNVWFAESGILGPNGVGVCRILTSGEVGKFSCFKEGLIASSKPTGLTVGPGGKLWFTDTSGVEEKQELEVTATGGTYKLSFGGKETGGEGSGNLLSAAKGKGDVKRFTTSCKRNANSKELKSCTTTVGAEVGMRITGTGIPTTEPFAVIEKIEGSTITISRAATSGTETSTTVTAGRIINVETTSGKFEVGETIEGTGISTSTIVSVGEEGGKGVLIPQNAPTAAGTGISLTGKTTTVVTNVTTSAGTFVKGETISGTGIPANTTVTAINTNLKTLTLSATPTEAKTAAALSSAFAPGASGEAIEEALKQLSTVGSSGVGVGKTGESPVKREITFVGSLKDRDVEQIVCNGAGLTGGGCTVATTTQGVPDAVGCMTTSGKSCGRYPLAELYGRPGGITYSAANGNLWLTSGVTTSAVLGKVGVECVENCPPANKRTITVSKSPNPSTGAGIGTVSSKPKGIKCAQTCTEAVGHLYKGQAVVLTEAPYGETSKFKEWKGKVCNGSTASTCTIPADSNDYDVEAVFEGTSKAILSPTALTVSKGESEANRGYGTVKASGLTCESECDETTALYQGKITSPKLIAAKVVELKALAAFGSKFTGWSGGGCSGTEPSCKVTMDEAKTVTAEFAPLPGKALTVEKAYSGGLGTVSTKVKGIKCGNSCTQAVASMPEGAAILLTAKAATTEPPSTFVKWEGGDCNGKTETTCTVTMDKAETVKAVFSGPVKAIANAQKLTLNRTGAGSGTVKASGLACEGLCTSTSALYAGPITEPKVKAAAKVILKAASAPGSKAVEWTGCASNPTPSECAVEMSAAKEVTAKFDELE